MKITTAYASAWIASGVAVSVAILVTKDATPLWALLIPAFLKLDSK
jgi:hypothetical protein